MARHRDHEHHKHKATEKINKHQNDADRLKAFLEDQLENMQTLAKKLPAGPLADEVHQLLADQKDDIPDIVKAVVRDSHHGHGHQGYNK